MQKSDDGTVQHDDELCIGCGTCARSCPYDVPVLFEDLNIARKCDACRPFREAGQNPVCVDACTMRCLDFGDVDELRSTYGNELQSDLPLLPSSDETNPTTLIAPKQTALNPEFKEVIL